MSVEAVKEQKSVEEIKQDLANKERRARRQWIENTKMTTGVLEDKLIVTKGNHAIVIDAGELSIREQETKSEYMYSNDSNISKLKRKSISVYRKGYETGKSGIVEISNIGWGIEKGTDGTPRGDLENYPWKIKTDSNFDGTEFCESTVKESHKSVVIYLTEEEFKELVELIQEELAVKENIQTRKKITENP